MHCHINESCNTVFRYNFVSLIFTAHKKTQASKKSKKVSKSKSKDTAPIEEAVESTEVSRADGEGAEGEPDTSEAPSADVSQSDEAQDIVNTTEDETSRMDTSS